MTRTVRALAIGALVLTAGCQQAGVDLAATTPAPVRTVVVVHTAESIGTPRTTVTAARSLATNSSGASTTNTSSVTNTSRASALDVLATITVENEHHAGYQRERFGYPADLDGDGCTTRAEVLIRDSLTPAQVDASGCAVVAGDWYSPYDGVIWSDPAEVQIDHVVALSEAWDSGAWTWDPERLIAYGNDLTDVRSLRAVTGSVNGDKGNKDPSNWLPPDPAAVCPFLVDWVSIKARWGLSMDQSEFGRIRNVLTKRCPDQRIDAWGEVRPAAVPITAAPTPAPAPSSGDGCDPSYPTVCIPPSPPDLDCGDIPYRRFEVLPPDPHRFDGDDNGVGCER